MHVDTVGFVALDFLFRGHFSKCKLIKKSGFGIQIMIKFDEDQVTDRMYENIALIL